MPRRRVLYLRGDASQRLRRQRAPFHAMRDARFDIRQLNFLGGFWWIHFVPLPEPVQAFQRIAPVEHPNPAVQRVEEGVGERDRQPRVYWFEHPQDRAQNDVSSRFRLDREIQFRRGGGLLVREIPVQARRERKVESEFLLNLGGPVSSYPTIQSHLHEIEGVAPCSIPVLVRRQSGFQECRGCSGCGLLTLPKLMFPRNTVKARNCQSRSPSHQVLGGSHPGGGEIAVPRRCR